ncbi:MAG: glycosyltransferase family 4 protein [Chloroflexi bacterium]|nr:glycosyltransferase family 4 protein [Chloroflexota bacterium]
MRVLMLSKALVIGAYQKKAEELARIPGVELTVAVPPLWEEGRHRIYLERAFVSGYRLVVEPMAFNGSFHLHFYPGLGRLIREVQPEVFHIDEEPYNLATFLGLRLSRKSGAKALFFTWQNLLRRLPPPFSQLEGYNFAHADWALAGSEGARDVLLRKGFRKPISVIPQFGVDPALYSPDGPTSAQSEGVSPPFTIGYVGRMIQAKGVDLLLRAASGLPGEWRLVLMGEGPLKDELRRQSDACGLGSRVSFVPHQKSGDVPAYLRALDVLVLPSRTAPNWKEQFGRVLVEAMACGVPVIGSDSGEIPQVIGDAGLVFPEDNVEDLRRALNRVMDDAGLRSEMAERGRERALGLYSQARIAHQTHEVYRRMLG